MFKISKIFVVINLVSGRSDFDDVPKEANLFVKPFIAPRLDFSNKTYKKDLFAGFNPVISALFFAKS